METESKRRYNADIAHARRSLRVGLMVQTVWYLTVLGVDYWWPRTMIDAEWRVMFAPVTMLWAVLCLVYWETYKRERLQARYAELKRTLDERMDTMWSMVSDGHRKYHAARFLWTRAAGISETAADVCVEALLESRRAAQRAAQVEIPPES